MNPGLRYLLWKGPLAKARRLRRRFRGPKGILVAAGIVVLVAMILGPQIFVHSRPEDAARKAALAQGIRTWGPPLALLGVLLLGISRGALYFRPAEIQFLFPAPIPRRQLLLYNVASRLRVQMLSALWATVFLIAHTRSWYTTLLGTFLLLAFLQLSAQASGLLFAAVGEGTSRRVRRMALLVVVLGVAGTLAAVLASLPPGTSPLAAARAAARLPAVRAAAWITRPFAEVLVAASLGGCFRWAVLACAILAAEIAAMLALDVAYTEGALAQGERIQKMLRRIRSGGGVYAAAGAGKARFPLPAFPPLGGAGPIAWRQCQEMVRNLRGVLILGFVMLVWVGAFAILPAVKGGGKGAGPHGMPPVVPLVMVVLVIPLMTANISFDFRRDLDRMATLKSLPLSPVAVAAGQTAPMVMLLIFWQAIGVILVAVATGGVPAPWLAGILLLLPPLDWVFAAVDNTLFLLMPYRVAPRDPGNLPFLGRLMLVVFAKMLLVGIVVGLALLGGWAAWAFVARSPLAAAAVAWAILAAACVPFTLWAGAAFDGFDVSTDIPG